MNLKEIFFPDHSETSGRAPSLSRSREIHANSSRCAALVAFLLSSPVFADSTCPDVSNSFVNMAEYAQTHGLSGVLADPVYATSRNFTGTPVDGYNSQKVWLPPEIIEKLTNSALPAIQQQLRALGLDGSRFRIIVKDGYRPHRGTTDLYNYVRSHNMGSGWAASGISGHNKGYTVDLTLGYLNDAGIVQEVWMGAHFDEFNANSNHGTSGRTLATTDVPLSYDDPVNAPHDGYIVLPKVTALQLRNALKSGIVQAGFSSYSQEYWHYTLSGHADAPCYDRPIQ